MAPTEPHVQPSCFTPSAASASGLGQSGTSSYGPVSSCPPFSCATAGAAAAGALLVVLDGELQPTAIAADSRPTASRILKDRSRIMLRLLLNGAAVYSIRRFRDSISPREGTMKKSIFALFLLVAAPAVAQQRVPDIPFDSSADFLKLPAGMNFGEVPGVAVNSKGHVFVFTRSNSAGGPAYAPTAAQLLECGPKGEFIREIGKGLYRLSFAHSVRIDKDDNIWAIDKGSDMIIKFDQSGRVQMVFG